MGTLVIVILLALVGVAIWSVFKKDDNSSNTNGGGGGGSTYQGGGVYDQNGHPVTSGPYR